MSTRSKKSDHNAISQPPGEQGGGGEKKEVPLTRRRVHYDRNGQPLRSIGCYFEPKLYFEYKKLALFRHKYVFELINDAMRAYLPELKKGTMQKLIDEGHIELPIE